MPQRGLSVAKSRRIGPRPARARHPGLRSRQTSAPRLGHAPVYVRAEALRPPFSTSPGVRRRSARAEGSPLTTSSSTCGASEARHRPKSGWGPCVTTTPEMVKGALGRPPASAGSLLQLYARARSSPAPDEALALGCPTFDPQRRVRLDRRGQRGLPRRLSTSGIAPAEAATTGVPDAMASSTGSPNPSYPTGRRVHVPRGRAPPGGFSMW
jgi:hypothetical protein